MTVEYSCIFGISSVETGLEPGAMVQALRDGLTVLTIRGKDNRIFWFIIQKLDQKYVYPNSPRFSPDDAAEACAQIADVHVYKDLHVRDLWKTRLVASMTALEEFLLQTWHYDRMVLLGDSIHKVFSQLHFRCFPRHTLTQSDGTELWARGKLRYGGRRDSRLSPARTGQHGRRESAYRPANRQRPDRVS